MADTKKDNAFLDPIYTRTSDRAQVYKRLRGMYLRCYDISSEDIRVFNISEGGLGVDTENVMSVPAKDKICDAKLLIGRSIVTIKIQFVHMSAQITGFSLIQPSEQVEMILASYLKPELAGAELRPNGSIQRAAQTGVYKFSGKNGNEAEIHCEGEKVVSFDFLILGNHLVWNGGADIFVVHSAGKNFMGQFLKSQLSQVVSGFEFLQPVYRRQIEEIVATHSVPAVHSEVPDVNLSVIKSDKM